METAAQAHQLFPAEVRIKVLIINRKSANAQM